MNRVLSELIFACAAAFVVTVLYRILCVVGGLFLIFGGGFSPEASRKVDTMSHYPIVQTAILLAVGLFFTLEILHHLLVMTKSAQPSQSSMSADGAGRYTAEIPNTPAGLRFYAKNSEHDLHPPQASLRLLTTDPDFDRFFWVEGDEGARSYLTPSRRNLLLRIWPQMPEAIWESGRISGQLSQPLALQRRVELLQQLARELEHQEL